MLKINFKCISTFGVSIFISKVMAAKCKQYKFEICKQRWQSLQEWFDPLKV